MPCVTGQWVVAAPRVLSNGQPVVLMDSQAICVPNGTPLLPVAAQTRVIGTLSRMNLRFPFQFDGRGRTAEAEEEAYVRDLIEQVLFTAPGERVMRPDFGSGLLQLVFAPNSPELAATTQMLVQGALQQWLGDLIALEGVEVEAIDATLRVTVRYVITRTQVAQAATFERGSVTA